MGAEASMRDLGYAPNPGCRVCQGLGWVYCNAPLDHPDRGRVVECSAPGCLKEQREAHRRGDLSKVGLPPKSKGFESFYLVKGSKEAYEAAKEFAYGRASYIWLLIYGGTGNGKSHLVEAMAKALVARGVPVVLHDVGNLMDKLKAGIGDHTIDQMVEDLKHINTLILDDWGANYGTLWEEARFETILSHRYRGFLPTVLTTNLPLDQLPERVVSRFSDPERGKVILNSSGDFRRQR